VRGPVHGPACWAHSSGNTETRQYPPVHSNPDNEDDNDQDGRYHDVSSPEVCCSFGKAACKKIQVLITQVHVILFVNLDIKAIFQFIQVLWE
jgi:hypothetical protein